MSPTLRDRISSALIKKGLISQKDLDKALKIQKRKGGKLSDILVGEGFVEKDALMSLLSLELGVPPINLSRYKIDAEVLNLIPKKIALHYNILPISKMGNILTVAMADPLNVFAVDDIKALTGFKIGPVVTTDKDMRDAIEHYYGEDTHHAVEKIIEDIEEAKRIQMVEESSVEDIDSQALMKLTQEAPVVKVTDRLLSDGIRLKASDILIEPLEHEMRVRYRVDGLLREGRKPPRTMHAAIVSRLKVMSNLNIAERRLPQDGRFKIKIAEREVDFRISVLPSSMGEKAALRILDKSQAVLDLNKLGFEREPLDDLKKASARPHGMILICGPTGCGKTTTLYSILNLVDSPEKNIVTVEDPVEYQLKGINQVAIQSNIGLTFAASLRSILRQDPDVIMVGEIRDFNTVDIAIKAALTGHLVLSTLHTTTACGSIVRMVNMGVEPFLISSSVVLVAAQRLIRKVCPKCSEEYKVNESILKRLRIDNIKAPVILHKGRGCKTCENTGYKGRIGLAEVLVLTPTIKDLIARRAQESEIKAQAIKEGMKTLRENGLAKVLAGLTTLEEVVRVTVGDQAIEA
ncbi:MAG: Flp pilus assembly complex ATPase component TadA [Candidatus Omnitrophica bacterium]|nr:Flp pilus assembly complex ATPase component TadA [Candidatus Omnitrophota bacterium]